MGIQSGTVRRYAAIMFTDIVGFSRIAQRDENLTIELLDEHYTMLRAIFGGHGGREIKTIGDSFMVEFADPFDAVRSAIDIQKALYDRNGRVPPDRTVTVRIGIHAGEVVVKGTDLFGNGVNIAARIEPQSPPGGIAVSAHVREAVGEKLGMAFEKMDVGKLKNIEKQIDLFKVVLPWLSSPAIPAAPVAQAAIAEPQTAVKIAVFPLGSAGPPEDAFLAAGITAQLISTLATLSGLRVVGPESVDRYAGPSPDFRAAGKALGTGCILAGLVRVGAGQIVLEVALHSAVSGEPLWKQSFYGDFRNPQGPLADCARRVAKEIGVSILEAEGARIDRPLTGNPAAYIGYMKARFLMAKGTAAAAQNALDGYRGVLDQDPSCAIAHVGVAESFNALALTGEVPQNSLLNFMIPGAFGAAQKAIELNRFLSDAYLAQGVSRTIFSYDLAGAEREVKRALQYKPGMPTAYLWTALALAGQCRFAEAYEAQQSALELEPQSGAIRVAGALVWHLARVQDLAIGEAREAVETAPRSPLARLVLGLILESQGFRDKAVAEMEQAVAFSESQPLFLGALAWALGRSRRSQDATARLGELTDMSNRRPVTGYASVLAHIGMGNLDAAFAALDTAVDEPVRLFSLLNPAPLMDPLRKDARFAALLEKTGLTVAEGAPA